MMRRERCALRRMQEAIGACRDEIKGAAILWVVFFHAQLGLGGLLYDVQKIGYGGWTCFCSCPDLVFTTR